MFVVAGVSGKVGSVVAQELLQHGEKVRVVVRDAKQGEAWKKQGADVALADLTDTKALTAALQGARGFFTLLPPNYQVPGFFAHQRKTADSIVQAVKDARVGHVVILSSIGADLTEGTGPIRGLHHLETKLRESGVKFTAVRAGYFQENFANVIEPARGMGLFPSLLPSADYAFPQVATRGIGITAAYELMFPSAKSDVVDLAGPEYSMRQVAETLGQALGKKLQVVDVPAAKHVDTFKQAGMSQEMAEIMAEMQAGFASGKIRPVGDRLKLAPTPLAATVRAVVK